MRWFKHLLLQPLLVLLILLLLGGGAIAILGLSNTGTKLLVEQLHDFVPELTIDGVDGVLAQHVTADKVAWEDETTAVEARQVTLQHRFDFGTPITVHVEQLQVGKLVVRLKPTAADASATNEAFDLPTIILPVNVDAQQVKVDALEVWDGETLTALRDVVLTAQARDGHLYVDNLHAQLFDDKGTITATLNGTIALGKPHELDTQLQLDADSKKWGVGKSHWQIGGELLHYTLQGEADWQYAHYPRYKGQLKSQGTFADMQVENLQLQGAAGEAQAKGHIAWDQGFAWQADINGKQLNLQPFVADLPANLSTTLQTSGHLQDGKTQISLNLTQLQGKLRDYPVDIKGQGDWNGKLLNVKALNALVGDNRLQASGQATDKVEVKWQIDAPKLAQLYPKFNGNAKGNGTLVGQVDGSQLQLAINELNGKLEGYDVKAKGLLEWGQQRLLAKDLQVESGNNRIAVSGQATEPFDLQWKVDAKNLAKAWKGLEGSLQGEGIFKGKLTQPTIQADLQGKQLRFQDYRLGAIDLKASQDGTRYTILGSLKDFKTGETVIKAAKVDGSGTIENHQLTAQITHPDAKVDFRANGGWKDNQWRGTVSQLALRDTPAGAWDLASPVNLSAGAKSFSSSEVCLTHQGSKLCAKPEWGAQGLSVAGVVRDMPLVMARPWLPNTVELAGSVDADYRFEQRGGKPQAKVDIRLPDSAVTIISSNGKRETLRYSNAQANLSLNDRQLDTQAQLALTGYGTIQEQGQITLSPSNGNHRIDATITADMPDISWMERFSPQIEQLKGRAEGAVSISGSLSKPNVMGEARLVDAQVHLPETGVTLQRMNLTMRSQDAAHAAISGSLQAGQGTLQASGILSLANLPNWQANVNLQGNNLQLMNTHEIQALVSPDLQLQVSPANVAITGTVRIPETTVTLRELPQGASAYSDDVVIVGRRAARQSVTIAEKDVPMNITPNVLIELGDKVKFSGFGLDARLTGKLRVLRTRQDIIAEGALNVVDGIYKAYGQNLTIEKGRLMFNGALDNPGLDVKAVREVEDGDITVGIALAGTVKQPESTLFSSPTQTQSDTLSYLLTGRAMSGLTGDQSSLLTEAITGLGIAGGESLAQQFGGSLGLDDVKLKAKNGDIQQSELALGKRLGPKLYVRYIVGLFDSLQRLAITYQINKHLQLEAQTGVQQSMDLIYKIDTNTGFLGK